MTARGLALSFVVTVLIWLVISCQATGVRPGEVTPSPQPAITPTVKGGEPAVAGEAEPLVARAKKDLAKRLSISEDSIKVISVDEVQWPDSSLGCPEPGKMYAQVITPGYKVILEADGQSYEYHTDKSKTVVYCAR